MKQINVLEIKDFKEIAVKVKRAFYLRKIERVSIGVIEGLSSWNVLIAPSIDYFSMYSDSVNEFIDTYNLQGVIDGEEVEDDILPLRIIAYGEYDGEDYEHDVLTDLAHLTVDDLAKQLYLNYISIVAIMINEVVE